MADDNTDNDWDDDDDDEDNNTELTDFEKQLVEALKNNLTLYVESDYDCGYYGEKYPKTQVKVYFKDILITEQRG